MRFSTHAARATALLALALAIVATCVGYAFAAPTEPTMDTTTLQSRLDASPLDGLGRHHLSGYFKTVVQGSTITSIPMEVLGITGGETADTSLILFEANGPLIDRYGGIVEGMSGSPLFIDDGGTDKLIGALSYGDMFTIGGTGLATPIGEMTKLEDAHPAQVESFSHPIVTTSGVIDRVIVSPNPAKFAAEAKKGALVAKPLSTFYLGGVPSTSKVFASLKKDLAAHGMDLIGRGALSGTPAVGSTDFQTDLVGGASVAALLSRGDLWLGSVGTVTYATSDTVLAYGHPAQFDGATSMYMTNAWVDGIWPSQLAPYKLARPTAVRGEITEDRGAGIMGRLGSMPTETSITANVTDVDSGKTTSTAVFVPSKLLDTSDYYSEIVPLGIYPAASRLLDVGMTGGSAQTTTTIVVSDGTTTHTIVQPNVIDDSYDLLDTITFDSWNDVQSLQAVIGNGLEPLHIVSVNLDAQISAHHRSAQIVAVDVPGGVKTGLNHVNVSVLAYGQLATQTVQATFFLPAGINTQGILSASSAQDSMDFYDYLDTYNESFVSRQSISDIVEDLNATQANNVIKLSYQPNPTFNEDDMFSPKPITDPEPIETSATTTWYLTGAAEAGTPLIRLRRSPSVVDYGGSTFLSGTISGPSDVGTVSVWAHRSGVASDTLLGTADLMYTSFGPGVFFSFEADGLKSNTTLRVTVDPSPDGEWASASASALVRVKPYLKVATSAKTLAAGKRVTLSSVALPHGLGGTIVFQQYNASQKAWRSIASSKLHTVNGVTKASVSWKPRGGKHRVRAHYVGGPDNVAGSSGSVTITVK